MIPTIAISMGDYNGIGPEVILKTLDKIDLTTSTPLVLGHISVLDFYAIRSNLESSFHILDKRSMDIKKGMVNVLNISSYTQSTLAPGTISPEAGDYSMKSVESGIELCKNKTCNALVTAPISKEAIQIAGYNVPGHTEFLAKKTSAKNYMMMLVSENIRVGLATIHIPLKEVATNVTKAGILKHLEILNASLINDFNITKPRIAVLGLNPHAGDGGIIGDEEQTTIIPSLQAASSNGISVNGPFAADGFFGKKMHEEYDAILAMYHDQGLIPFKTLTFGEGVNFTAGLPIIRTSPDHGTAFDIAGKNQADKGSFESAYQLAVEMSRNQVKNSTS